MSRLYETVAPSVIDNEMLQTAVEEQGPKNEAKKIAKKEGLKYANVLSLSLSFRNILHICNLWEFTSLTKLQLDNNIIETIEGLDLLVNLVWLDFSFNNIEIIEGLSKLTKLQDLTLFNNRISKIENLDAQKELQVFSIGNNEIKDMQDIIYLRSFTKLKALNIINNPVCSEENFRQFVIASLPNLEFLDYKTLFKSMKAAAHALFKEYVDELDATDKDNRILEEAHLRQEIEHKLHKEAFVEYLNTKNLFVEMYIEDVDGNKLTQMPGAGELVTAYMEKFMEICLNIFNFGLEEHKKRKAEEEMFWECVNEAKNENRQQGMDIINEYMKEKVKLYQELQNVKDVKRMENRLQKFSASVSFLWEKLMMFELQLVDQLEEVIKEFERNMQELVSVFLENVQGFLAEMRELENIHNEKITECAVSAMDKAVKNELEEDVTEELRILLMDKDMVMIAVSSSHDFHCLKIDNREDEIITGIKTWLKNLIDGIHQKEEIFRNRTRVLEINHLIQYFHDELSELEMLTGEEDALSVHSKIKLVSFHCIPERLDGEEDSATSTIKEEKPVETVVVEQETEDVHS